MYVNGGISMEPVLSIMIISIMIGFVISLIYRLTTDINKLHRIKMEMEQLKEKMNQAKKKKDEKEIKKLIEKNMKLTHEQMHLMMKPLLVSMVIIFLVLPELKKMYAGTVFKLPFPLPHFGSTVGWLGLYIIFSLPPSLFFRKLLKVD